MIESGANQKDITTIGTDGTAYETTIDIPMHSLIKKADYYLNIPNYIPIEDHSIT